MKNYTVTCRCIAELNSGFPNTRPCAEILFFYSCFCVDWEIIPKTVCFPKGFGGRDAPCQCKPQQCTCCGAAPQHLSWSSVTETVPIYNSPERFPWRSVAQPKRLPSWRWLLLTDLAQKPKITAIRVPSFWFSKASVTAPHGYWGIFPLKRCCLDIGSIRKFGKKNLLGRLRCA